MSGRPLEIKLHGICGLTIVISIIGVTHRREECKNCVIVSISIMTIWAKFAARIWTFSIAFLTMRFMMLTCLNLYHYCDGFSGMK